MRVAAVMAPRKTDRREYFMAIMVVMMNVLSPSSEARMTKSAATKPLAPLAHVWAQGASIDGGKDCSDGIGRLGGDGIPVCVDGAHGTKETGSY